MQSRTLGQAAPALALAVLVLAAPAVAAPTAPSPDSPPGAPGALQHLADWWSGVTEPLVALFAPHGHGVDPDGEPTATSTADDPTDHPELGPGVDPDG